MLHDTDVLRARLRVASLLLLAAAGCTAPPTPGGDLPAVPATPASNDVATAPPEKPPGPTIEPIPVVTTPAESPTLPSEPTPEPRIVPDKAERPRPTCPTITWTVSVAEANREGKSAGTGCPATHDGIGMGGKLVADTGDGQCTYTGTKPCPGGRPLLDDGRARVAEVVADTAWTGTPTRTLEPPASLRDALAAAWQEDACSEHASVASFARATLELLALAAPPALVTACQRASLDEVEHARVCFALAAGYVGAPLGPGPLPAVAPRPADLVRLACDTFVEGCVGETIATLTAARAARGCADPAVATALARIADDEAEHAALAWATVAWAAERGGEPVRAAVRALAGRLHAEARAAPAYPADPSADLLARHGRLDPAARHACMLDAWEQLIAPAVDDLA